MPAGTPAGQGSSAPAGKQAAAQGWRGTRALNEEVVGLAAAERSRAGLRRHLERGIEPEAMRGVLLRGTCSEGRLKP